MKKIEALLVKIRARGQRPGACQFVVKVSTFNKVMNTRISVHSGEQSAGAAIVVPFIVAQLL